MDRIQERPKNGSKQSLTKGKSDVMNKLKDSMGHTTQHMSIMTIVDERRKLYE